MLNRTFHFFIYSIFTPFIYRIVTFNPNWLNNFPEKEKAILDRWNGIDNVQMKVLLLYLASPFLLFDDNDFIIYFDDRDRVKCYLNLLFSALFAFLGLLLAYSAYQFPNVESLEILIGMSAALLIGSFGMFAATFDFFAAFYVRKVKYK